MKLIDQWGTVLRKSWSVWFGAASAFFLALLQNVQQVVQIWQSLDLSILPAPDQITVQHWLGWAALVCAVLVPVARVLDQPGMGSAGL